MKKPIHKIAFLFGLYVAMHFVAACSIDCSCPTVRFPFFDYRTFHLTTNDPVADKALKIDISLDSVFFLAEASPQRGLGFISSVAACDCDFDGSSGDKFPVVAMDVFADRDFNDLLPKDSSLISLFEIVRIDPGTDAPSTIYGPLFGQFGRRIRLTATTLPQNLDQPFVFNVRVIKSNSDTISIQTDTIRFQ